MSKSIAQRLEERFLRYSAIPSQSDAKNAGKCLPTSPGQQTLAELLAEELRAAGLTKVVCDQHATVTAVCPGRVRDCPTIGFICHLDTFDAGLSPVVRAQRLHYAGGDVCLNKEQDIWLRAAEHPEIAVYKGQDILFSDGTSVLGADDKAAVSAVMEMVSGLTSGTEEHGDVVVCFVPDEEIGLLGAKQLDLATRFPVDFAYTLDCCELGEVVYECFNAASVSLTFTGVTAHPMSAKGVMVNPVLMATDYMAAFDRTQTPECTEMREGYWWFMGVEATPTVARVTAAIRDHDYASFERRKETMREVAAEIGRKYPSGKVEIVIDDVYANIANAIKDDRMAIDLLMEALAAADVKPKVIPMRGGTDGAALSVKGLLTPNFFTGAHNFHSRFEFLPIPSFVKAYEVSRQIVLLGAQKKKKTKTASAL